MNGRRRLYLTIALTLVALLLASGAAGAESRDDPPRAMTAARATAWVHPVPGPLHVNQAFRPPRHHGLDLAAALGDPVMAVMPGIVVEVDRDLVYGIHVVVAHPGGLRTLYAHLSRACVEVDEGVRAGFVLGRVGLTGRTSGAHLHLGLERDGRWLDPLPELLGGE